MADNITLGYLKFFTACQNIKQVKRNEQWKEYNTLQDAEIVAIFSADKL